MQDGNNIPPIPNGYTEVSGQTPQNQSVPELPKGYTEVNTPQNQVTPEKKKEGLQPNVSGGTSPSPKGKMSFAEWKDSPEYPENSSYDDYLKGKAPQKIDYVSQLKNLGIPQDKIDQISNMSEEQIRNLPGIPKEQADKIISVHSQIKQQNAKANTLKPPEKQLKTAEGTTLPTLTVKAPKQQPLGFAQYNPETLAKKDEKVTPKSIQQVQKENDANDMANTAYHAADTDPQAAMLLAQKAAQLHPEQYKDYENTLGRYAAVKAGNMPQAEKYSDAAIKTSPTVENLKWGVYTAQTPDKKLQYANKALSMSTPDDKELDDQAYIADLKSEQLNKLGDVDGANNAKKQADNFRLQSQNVKAGGEFGFLSKPTMTNEEWSKAYKTISNNFLWQPILSGAESFGKALEGLHDLTADDLRYKIPKGVDQLTGEQYKDFATKEKYLAFTKLVQGTAGTVFNTNPSVYWFNTKMGAASEAEKLIFGTDILNTTQKWVFAPLTSALSLTGFFDKPIAKEKGLTDITDKLKDANAAIDDEMKRNVVGIFDILTTMGIMHGANELGNKAMESMKDGKPDTAMLKEKIQDSADNLNKKTGIFDDIKNNQPITKEHIDDAVNIINEIGDVVKGSQEAIKNATPEMKEPLTTEKQKENIENIDKLKAVVEVDGKTYTGETHDEAIENAQKENPDFKPDEDWKEENGKFEVTTKDGKTDIIDREQAKKNYGEGHSENLKSLIESEDLEKHYEEEDQTPIEIKSDTKYQEYDAKDEDKAKEFAIDAVQEGHVETRKPTEKIKEGQWQAKTTVTGERLDLGGMSNANKIKAVADIKAGKYDTAPAKELLSKLQDMYKEGQVKFLGAPRDKVGVPIEDFINSVQESKTQRMESEATGTHQQETTIGDVVTNFNSENESDAQLMSLKNIFADKHIQENGRPTTERVKLLSKDQTVNKAMEELNSGSGNSIDNILERIRKGNPVSAVDAVKLSLETHRLETENRKLTEKNGEGKEPYNPANGLDDANKILSNIEKLKELDQAIKDTGSYSSEAMSIRKSIFRITQTPDGFIREIETLTGERLPENEKQKIMNLFKQNDALQEKLQAARKKIKDKIELSEDYEIKDLVEKYDKANAKYDTSGARRRQTKAKVELQSIYDKWHTILNPQMAQATAIPGAREIMEIMGTLPDLAKALVKIGVADSEILIKRVQGELAKIGINKEYSDIRRAILQKGEYAKEAIPKKLSEFQKIRKELSAGDRFEEQQKKAQQELADAKDGKFKEPKINEAGQLRTDIKKLRQDAVKELITSKNRKLSDEEKDAAKKRYDDILDNIDDKQNQLDELPRKNKELADVKDEIKRIKKESGFDDAKALEKYKADRNKRLLQLDKDINEGNVEVRKAKARENLTEEMKQTNIAIERNSRTLKAMREEAANKNKTNYQKALDRVVGLKLSNILLSTRILFKLFGIGVLRVAGRNLGEVWKAAMHNTVGKISPNFAKGTIYEGGANWKALWDFDKTFFKEYVPSMKQQWKYSIGESDIEFGKEQPVEFKKVKDVKGLWNKAGAFLDNYQKFSTTLHSMEKSALTMAEEKYARERLLQNEANAMGKKSIQISDLPESKQNEINKRAWESGLRIKFRQTTATTNTWNNLTRTTPETSNAAYAGKTALKFVVPFMGVPTNIFSEGLEHAFGLLEVLAKLTIVGFKTGDLTDIQKERIISNLSKGTLGAAMSAYAYCNPSQFIDDKGRFSRLFGVPIPHGIMNLIGEHPLLIPIQIAGRIAAAQTENKQLPEEKQKNQVDLMSKAVEQTGERVPFVSQMLNPQSPSKFVENALSGLFVPQLVNEVAKTIDIPESEKAQVTAYLKNYFTQEETIPRTPVGFWETVVLQNVPYFREQIESKAETTKEKLEAPKVKKTEEQKEATKEKSTQKREELNKELEKEGTSPVGEKQKKPKDERKENRGGGRHGKRTKISENEVQSDYDENKLYGK
jgi:hypothetical protein